VDDVCSFVFSLNKRLNDSSYGKNLLILLRGQRLLYEQQTRLHRTPFVHVTSAAST